MEDAHKFRLIFGDWHSFQSEYWRKKKSAANKVESEKLIVVYRNLETSGYSTGSGAEKASLPSAAGGANANPWQSKTGASACAVRQSRPSRPGASRRFQRLLEDERDFLREVPSPSFGYE
jgi:hypothetical protein